MKIKGTLYSIQLEIKKIHMYAHKKNHQAMNIYKAYITMSIFLEREREREIFLDGSVLVGRLIMLIKEGKDCYKTKESRLI
jgi:hypothetical protein